jgi:hypothetical protein
MTLSNNLCSASVQSKRRPSGYSLEPRLTRHGPMGVLAHPPLRSRDSGSGWGDGFPRCDQPGDLRGAPASPREFQWPKPDYVLPLVSGRGERTADRPPEGEEREGENSRRSTGESKGFAEWLSGISNTVRSGTKARLRSHSVMPRGLTPSASCRRESREA